MSKPTAATAPKLQTPLPQRSAWARGPPNSSSASSPRSQSPASASVSSPVATSHSRRPSTLGQGGVSFRDGVAGARSPVGPPKSGVTFGSIDDVSAPISSSPASVPPIKTEAPKTFGSVTATPSSVPTSNGKSVITPTTPSTPAATSSTAAPSAGKPPPPPTSTSSTPATSRPSQSSTAPPASKAAAAFDVKKLFQNPSSSAPPSSSPSQPPPEVSPSPSTRPVPLPQQLPSSGSQPSQFGGPSFTPFVPGGGLRPQPNGTNGTGPPRSPVYTRPTPNNPTPAVNVNGRPPAPGTPAAPPTPLTPGMPSPRMGPHAGQPQPGMQPPGQPVAWPAYYYGPYPGMPDPYGMYPPAAWGMPQHVVPPHQHPHTPGVPPPHQPPHPGMMSPRNLPSNLHPPGTPTMPPASVPAPAPAPAPSPHMHTSSLASVTSPPTTPSSSTGPGAQMDRHAKPFVPRKPVVIKDDSGHEVNLQNFRKSGSNFQPPPAPGSPARKAVSVRLETEEAKAKREKEAAERARREKEEEEKAQKEKEEAERKKKEEEEKRRQEEERERIRKEEEEKERIRKEEEEKERIRKEEEEKERKRKEEEERKKREEEERERQEQERIRKEEEDKERLRKEEEERQEQERLRKEEEERKAKEAEAEAKAAAEAAAAKEAASKADEELKETEEGEVADAKEKKEEGRDKPSPLRIDTAVTERKRPGPLDLSGTKGPIPQPLPSALATARVIEDLSSIEYPEGVKSPQVELNVNAKQGKFRYDRDFLLQFMAICKEKPDSLPPLDAIGLEPSEQNFPMVRGGSGRRQTSMSMGPSTSGRQGSFGLGIAGVNKPPGGFNMGQFATVGSKMTSEERFAASARSASMSSSGPAGMPFGRPPPPMSRQPSQGGVGSPMGSNRTRSKRGEKRGEASKSQAAQSAFTQSAAAAASQAFEPVAPLEMSANRWTASSVGRKPQQIDENSPEVVERKVKALLNKLTMEKFDSISDQIIAWANKSEAEKDGRTLIQVIRLVFEKATDEATWSEMYARLCRKMMEQISPKVQDDGIRNSEGKPITGGHLFRKYLLNRCQEDFERGWASKEAAAAAAATKASQDEATKAANENNANGESELYSDEYYAAQKAKRQGLGLIKFIGELFKLQMLTERIMHECVKKLLGNVENPEEEEIESLCKLLTTVGQLLDTPKARAHMDVYFSRMKELTKSPNVTSRMQFMLQDVIELRERKWVPRNAVAAPTTIAAVHEAAAKEKAAAEKDNQYQRTLSMSRGGSRRGSERPESQVGPDGWAVAGGAQNRAPPKAGDLSKFGKIDKSQPMTFGPSSIFAGKKDGNKRDSTIPRTGSSNIYSILGQNPELAAEVPQNKSSRPPSRKPSIDLGSGGAPDTPPQRRKLNLLPRSKPIEQTETPAQSAPPSEDEASEAGATMSEEEAKKRIDEDVREFFAIRNLDEAEIYFTKLPNVHRHLLVDKLVTKAVESKEADAQLVAEFFARAASKDLCSPAMFEEGVMPTAEIIDDVAIDAPLALSLFAKMLKGIGLDEERRGRIANKSMDSDKLLEMLS